MEPRKFDEHAGPPHFIVKFRDLGRELLGSLLARLTILAGFHDHHEPHFRPS
jgi:hypothetical protein